MDSRGKLMRLVALLILTAAACDLFVIDFSQPVFCSDQDTSQNDSTRPNTDDCFCCCNHIVLIRPIQLEPAKRVTVAESFSSITVTSVESAGIYHPPRI